MDSSVAAVLMAVAMMAGPRIIAAMMPVTSGGPVRNSTAVVGGIIADRPSGHPTDRPR